MKTQRVTPDWLAQEIARLKFNNTVLPKRVLEPSCGDGAIVKYLVEKRYEHITAIELNKDKLNIVKENYPNVNCIHGDFLNIEFNEKFHAIFAMPPFKENIDLKHIMKMYDLLEDDGELTTGISNKFMYNNEDIHLEFREWLKDKDYRLQMLPDNTFVEKGKSVHTFILIMYKSKINFENRLK